MNERQQKFVERYMAHGNASRAAVEAGYSETRAASTASRLLATNGNVQTALQDYRDKLASEAKVDAAYLIERFKIEAEGRGPDTNSAARSTALDKLAKHLGFYETDNAQKTPSVIQWLAYDDDE